MLPTTNRRVSLLRVALSIVASIAMLLVAALVSAREPPKAAVPAIADETTQTAPDAKPTPATTIEAPNRSSETPMTGRRAPLCPGLVAKIVSQNRNPALSLASLSYDGNATTLVRPGSQMGEHRVVAIGYDGDRMSPTVVLSGQHGVCQAMTFERAEPVTRARSTRSGRKRVALSDHTEILVDRSAVSAILERAFELTRGVQVTPYLENGSIAGFRLLGIQRGSLLSALGLENGDSIIRINGKAMTTMESAMSFYSLIGAVDHFDIEVNRSGKLARVEIRIN